MPWTQLYTPLLSTNTVGNSLSTINQNFDNIDTYLENLAINLVLDQYLLRTENLLDVANASVARTNLQLTGDIAAFRDQKTVMQASVSFNPNSTFTLDGETNCIIIDSYNVDRVIYKSGYFEIRYSSPLAYIGPVVADAKYPTTTRIDSSFPPAIDKCRIVTSIMGNYTQNWRFQSPAFSSTCDCISVVSF